MKKTITGIIIGFILSMSIYSFASGKIGQSFFNDTIKLDVNGKQISTDILTIILESETAGKNYVSARDLSKALGATVEWDGVNKIIKVTSKIIATPNPSATPAPINAEIKLENEDDIKKYLMENYPEVNIGICIMKLDYMVWDNNLSILPYDYNISVKYDLNIYNEIKYGIKYADEQKAKAKNEMHKFIEVLAKDIISKMPDKKLYGNYSYSWYKYKYIQEGLTDISFYTWTNYDEPSFLIDDRYHATKVSNFRWYPKDDDEF